MALIPIAGPFFTKVDTVFGGFFLNGASNVASAVTPIFKIMVSLYVVLWGLAMWRGLIQEPMSDGVTRVVKIVLIGSFALNMAVYGAQIATTIYKTPERLALVVMPTATTSGAANSLDNALSKGNDLATRFIQATSLTAPFASIVLGIEALLIWIFTGILVAYGAALVLLAKIGLAIVLALGPIFIGLLLFEATRTFFQGWLAQALNFLFTYVLVALAIALALTFLDSMLTQALVDIPAGSRAPDFAALLPVLIVGVGTFLVLKQVPGIASGLAGGMQLSTLGAVGWAMRSSGRALTSPARGFERYQRYKDRQLMRQHYRAQIDAAKGKSDDVSDQTLTDPMRGQNAVVRK